MTKRMKRFASFVTVLLLVFSVLGYGVLGADSPEFENIYMIKSAQKDAGKKLAEDDEKQPITEGTVTLTAPKCGEEFTMTGPFEQKPYLKMAFTGDITTWSGAGQQNTPNDSMLLASVPENDSAIPDYFEGKLEGGRTYCAYFPVMAKSGFKITKDSLSKLTFKGMTRVMSKYFEETPYYPSYYLIYATFKAPHDWDKGKVTKKATVSKEGVKTYTCRGCGKTKTEAIPKLGSDPKQMGTDGTALGKGASAAAANKAITGMKNDKDPKGARFSPLMLKSTKQSKKAVKLNWKKVSGAKKYVVYGNACGTKNRMKKLAVTKKNALTMKKVLKKKVKKATYYKFIVVALDKNNSVVSTSKVIHAATKGSKKKANNTGITVPKKAIKKAKALKVGKSLKLGAKAVKAKKTKVAKHVALRYESTNKKIAAVSAKGVITAKAKGSCRVYVYAQNGIAKKIPVTVR